MMEDAIACRRGGKADFRRGTERSIDRSEKSVIMRWTQSIDRICMKLHGFENEHVIVSSLFYHSFIDCFRDQIRYTYSAKTLFTNVLVRCL